MPPKSSSKSKRGQRPPLPFVVGHSVSTSASSASSPTPVLVTSSHDSPSTPTLDGIASEVLTKKKRSWNSPVWQHYETHDGSEFEDNEDRAICNYCGGGPIMADSVVGMSNFKRHSESCVNRISGAEGEVVLSKEGKLMRKVNQSVYKEIVCLSIIRHNYPFSYAEHEGTRNVHRYLNGDCKPFCRNTARNYVIDIHKREKGKLKEFLKNVSGRICLTSDMWTSAVDQGFISLTAHYIDDEWNLHAKILNFRHVKPPHTATVLHDTLLGLLRDWGIHKKVFTITLDNARCNDSMQSMLLDSLSLHSSLPCGGKYFHVRCSAHILNLVVQEGLKIIDESILKVKKLVYYVGGSERRALKFREIALSLGLDCSRKLCLDCPTRWNSTFKMLDRALGYRLAFQSGIMERTDLSFPLVPTDEEWDRIEKIHELLKPFDELTTLMSGRKYPTSNLYLKCVWKVELLLLKYAACGDDCLMDMANRMKKKFEKYWNSYSLILSFAIMLDPRFKFDLIIHCFEKLDIETAPYKSNYVKMKFLDLYKEYAGKNTQATIHETRRNDLGDFEGFSSFQDSSSQKSEIEIYLEEPRLTCTEELDVLTWWKDAATRFPLVSQMARDILAIPITTVASESAFSMGSRVITKWRSSLCDKTAEALLTTRSWLYGLDIEEVDGDNLEQGLELDFSDFGIDNDDAELDMEMED